MTASSAIKVGIDRKSEEGWLVALSNMEGVSPVAQAPLQATSHRFLREEKAYKMAAGNSIPSRVLFVQGHMLYSFARVYTSIYRCIISLSVVYEA